VQFKVLIEDKDSLIKELRDEGEKLSKQNLNLNTIIKRLRVAEKESLKIINKYKLVFLNKIIYLFKLMYTLLFIEINKRNCHKK